MGRLLVLIALVLIGVWLVRRALARAEGGQDGAAAPSVRSPEELVGCAQCGVLLPRGEARSAAGGAYCSDEHARLGPRRR